MAMIRTVPDVEHGWYTLEVQETEYAPEVDNIPQLDEKDFEEGFFREGDVDGLHILYYMQYILPVFSPKEQEVIQWFKDEVHKLPHFYIAVNPSISGIVSIAEQAFPGFQLSSDVVEFIENMMGQHTIKDMDNFIGERSGNGYTNKVYVRLCKNPRSEAALRPLIGKKIVGQIGGHYTEPFILTQKLYERFLYSPKCRLNRITFYAADTLWTEVPDIPISINKDKLEKHARYFSTKAGASLIAMEATRMIVKCTLEEENIDWNEDEDLDDDRFVYNTRMTKLDFPQSCLLAMSAPRTSYYWIFFEEEVDLDRLTGEERVEVWLLPNQYNELNLCVGEEVSPKEFLARPILTLSETTWNGDLCDYDHVREFYDGDAGVHSRYTLKQFCRIMGLNFENFKKEEE